MFSTDVTELSDRNAKFEGTVYYYKHGWLSNKWVKVYAKLWSDSTLEWFQSGDSDKPIASITLDSLVPYFCIGHRIKNIPTIKPKIKASWDKNLLMALATDIQASTVHWFYFAESENFRKWLGEIAETLPKVILPQNCLTNINKDCEITSLSDSSAIETSVSSNGPLSNQQPLENYINFDTLFSEMYLNYGLGEFFFPMIVDSSDYESEIENEVDNDEEYFKNAKVCESNDISHLNTFNTISIFK